jgi:hypothetical protein
MRVVMGTLEYKRRYRSTSVEEMDGCKVMLVRLYTRDMGYGAG